ncbi:unnamed protein product [Rotaria magnacalcarata]|uniref:Ectonucleoside triphosphate diphosphohydrolase 1 n=1 Tax=Rotaria magnacalcarata TaxID=392030 RepID=A0A816KQL7_9BILA|nr:unnamed protein product [Rotaria magnacalcarata]CAF4135792.1 unnamed protein product [Rotaria magnacalcarata]
MLTRTNLKIIFALAANITICSFLGTMVLIVLRHTKLLPFQDYALVVDAGSTHTKIFLYTWPADKSDGRGLTSRVYQIKSCSVNYGPITTISNATHDNIKQYFDSAMTNCINEIPLTRKSRTLIFFGATAGLRLAELRNSSYVNSLLNSTRTYLSSLGLLFRSPEHQVRIISGSEEGLSGWISVNILMRQLFENTNPIETYGVSDFGGGSTQLSFIAPHASKQRFAMNLFNATYDVYSHSYLCYGQEQSRLVHLSQLIKRTNATSLINDPCLQSGYIQNITSKELFRTACIHREYVPSTNLNQSTTFSFVGTGDYEKCQMTVKQRFNKSSCSIQNCSFDGVYQPVPISSSLKFIAVAGWYSVFKHLAPHLPLLPNKDKNYELASLNLTRIKQAVKAICNQSWFDVHDPDRYRPFLCFNSMLHWTLFEYGYSMTDENLKNFQIVKKIDSNEIGWTFGYMINQTNYLDPQYRPRRLLTQDEFIILLTLCLLLCTISLATAVTVIYVYKKHRK